MAGLLDNLMNDPAKLALLSAGIGILGNNRGNYGRAGPAISAGLQNGMQGLLAAQQYQQEQPMRELQRRKLQLELQRQEQQATMLAAIQKRMQGNQQPEPQAIDTGNMTLDPAKYPPPQQPQQQGLGLNYNDVAALNLAGGPNLLDFYKYENEPQERKGGSFYVNPITGQREFIPKVGEGMAFDQGGRVGLAPGYGDAVSELERRKAAAAAGYNMEKVETPQGTRMMTREQAAQWASGQPGQNPQPVPQGMVGEAQFPRVSPQQQASRDSDRARILQDELASATDPTYRAALEREIGMTSQPPGQPIIDPENQRKQAEFERASRDKDIERETAFATAENALSVIDKALNHPGRATSTGFSGVADPRNYIPGTDAKDFSTVLDQLTGKAFLEAFKTLKGGGQITEIEGKKATDAIARLSRRQSDDEFKESLKELRGVVQSGLERMQGGQSIPTQKQSNPAPSKTFKIDGGKSVIGKYDPQAGKYFVIQSGKKYFIEE